MNADSDAKHHALYKEADSAYKRCDFVRARKLFAEALRLAPGDPDTLRAVGNCWDELGLPLLAERFHRRALAWSRGAERGDCIYNIANAKFDQGLYASALALYAKVPPRSKAAYRRARRNMRLCRNRLAGLSQAE